MTSVGPRYEVPLSFSFGVSDSSSMVGWSGFILIEVALKSHLSSLNLLASCLLCVYDSPKHDGKHIAHPSQAVNALEGRVFNGNKITARFFDSEAFEKGFYSRSDGEGNGQHQPASRSGSL